MYGKVCGNVYLVMVMDLLINIFVEINLYLK